MIITAAMANPMTFIVLFRFFACAASREDV